MKECCKKFHEEGVDTGVDFINVVCDCECHLTFKNIIPESPVLTSEYIRASSIPKHIKDFMIKNLFTKSNKKS